MNVSSLDLVMSELNPTRTILCFNLFNNQIRKCLIKTQTLKSYLTQYFNIVITGIIL